MPISDFKELMNDTVSVTPFSSLDGFGKPSYGTSVDYANSRVKFKVRQVFDFEGQEVTAGGDVVLGSNAVIGATDKLTLPDNTTPKILNVESIPDESGSAHHTRIIFQ